MMKKLPNEVSWMEDYFNYREEGKMIMYKEVDENIKNLKLIKNYRFPLKFWRLIIIKNAFDSYPFYFIQSKLTCK